MFEVDETEKDDWLSDVECEAENSYIANANKAVELIATLLRNQKMERDFTAQALRKKLKKLFEEMGRCHIPGTFEFQKHYDALCGKLSEWGTVAALRGKSVVGLGGRFSAGKSNFINAITEMENPLPVEQNPTTSIPTYIMWGDEDKIETTSSFGYAIPLSREAMQALSHDFYNKYGIGFSAFLENIIIKTPQYGIDERIILLDTPGYSKAEFFRSAREKSSDRQKAFEKLNVADHLIWLVSVDNGTISTDDLEFLRDLDLTSPILFVVTKADLKLEEEVKKVVEEIETALSRTQIPTYGVTAYSSIEKKEYVNQYIKAFFQDVAQNSAGQNDAVAELKIFESQLNQLLISEIGKTKEKEKQYYRAIKAAEDISALRSVAELWRQENRRRSELQSMKRMMSRDFRNLNEIIEKKIGSEP